MKKNKVTSLILAAVVLITFFTGCGNTNKKTVTSADFTEEELDSSTYDVQKYTAPFWKGNIVYNECVFPIMDENDVLSPFELMYYADEIVSVKNYSLEIEYIEGVDYILEDGKLVILPTGNIPVKMQEDIHHKSNPNNYPVKYMYPHLDGNGYEFWNDKDTFMRSLFVTYIHNDEWDAPIPQSMADKLPRTMDKLKRGEDLTVVVTGDSISVGYNSSRIEATPPYADGYAMMAIKALREKYDSGIKFVNSAVGGSTAEYTTEQLDRDILRYNPSLVIIAYGMNDGMNKISAEEYSANINGRIEYIKEKLPDCEILLVTSYFANTLVFDQELFKQHASALYDIADKWDGVGICDPQQIQISLTENKHKEFMCFMADNLVHPNDYGMRIIAQCVIAALTE